MQIDLFSSRRVNKEFPRAGNQIMSKSFQLDAPIEGVRDFIVNQNVYAMYVKKLSNTLIRYQKGDLRYAQKIGMACSDSLFELEALGLARYGKKFTTIIDFSDNLDFMLNFLYDCKMNDVRKIKDYSRVSHALINFDFADTMDINVGVLLGVSPKLDEKIAALLANAEKYNISYSERQAWILYEFYLELIGTVNRLKDYTATAICLEYMDERKLIYRSKSFAASVLSSEVPFGEEITLKSAGKGGCKLNVKSYLRYEYAKEKVLYHEISG